MALTKAERARRAEIAAAKAAELEREARHKAARRITWAKVREAFRTADAPEEFARLCEDMRLEGLSPFGFDLGVRIAWRIWASTVRGSAPIPRAIRATRRANSYSPYSASK